MIVQVDQDVERVVSREEGEKWAKAHKLTYWETSAATGVGVFSMFHSLLQVSEKSGWLVSGFVLHGYLFKLFNCVSFYYRMQITHRIIDLYSHSIQETLIA